MDFLSAEQRSNLMRQVKSTNTSPELYVRSLLHRAGFRFRLHAKNMPGKPDIVLPKYKTVIFVHGCFWHRHENCKKATMPSSNTDFWRKKFENNIQRDSLEKKSLEDQGWNVVIIWTCELKKATEDLLSDLQKKKRNSISKEKKLSCIDLFAGCGGMSLGFLQAGYSIVAAFDNWKPAINCYKKNFPTHRIYDLNLKEWKNAVEMITPLAPDIIIGGPPCQDFSEAGHRIEGERANLTIAYAKIIAAIQPRFFVMENVPGARKSLAYATARNIFKSANYGLTEKVLDASLCGAPQYRKRFFCIGGLNCKDNFLLGTLNARLSEIPLSVKDYLKDEIDIDFYYKHPRTYGRRAIFSVNEPAATIRGCNRPLPHNYKKHRNDAAAPVNIRALATKELARIQTFPASFIWPQSNGIATQLIGNAVPVALANFIAVAIRDYSGGSIETKQFGFVDWLVEKKNFSVKAAGDVLSRFRRIVQLTRKREWDLSEIEVCFQRDPLIGLPQSAKTQLKRACVLHCEYIKDRKGNVQ